MNSKETELSFIYLIFDMIILNVAILFMSWLSFDISFRDYHQMSMYLMHGNFSWIMSSFVYTMRNLYLRDGMMNRLKQISKRMAVFLIVSALTAFLFLPKTYSRRFFVYYAVIFFAGQLFFYISLYTLLRYRRRRGLNVNRAIIVDLNDSGQFLRNVIESNPILGYSFLGFVSSNHSGSPNTLGNIEQLASVIEQYRVEIVFVTLSLFSNGNAGETISEICKHKGVRLRFVPDNQQWFKSRLDMESVGNLVMMNPLEIPLDKLETRFVKRLFDIVFSSIVILLVLSWSIPLIAFLVKLSSRGPVFFIQKRTGINNRPFNCIKFRSMCQNGESDLKQATADDHRITPVGRFLRNTDLDEIPQFLNVFMGDMSVVGPRPHMLKHTDKYSQLIEYYLLRHAIKPGVSGWAQINGYRGETRELWQMQKRVEYDIEYIENWTFWWDIKIIWLTVFGKRKLVSDLC